jgi:SHS2 domain-containing protein
MREGVNMEKYRFIEDLTSDVMFEAYGKDLREVFENAAEAMFSVICKLEEVATKKALDVELSAENKEELMINWLQELIALVDTQGMFFSKFEVIEIDERHLRGRVYGEDMKPEKGGTVVKAVTYYKFNFEKTEDGYKVRVSLDI